jgi:hypothetical protein
MFSPPKAVLPTVGERGGFRLVHGGSSGHMSLQE